MTADLKPCPFCGEKVEMHDYTNAFVAAWVMIHRCQVVGVIHLENYSGTRLAEVWNTRAPTVSDTGADTRPGASTSQPGEAPVSSAPAPTMADLIDNLMQIEMLTATGEGLDPATTIDVHLLAGIGRAVEDAQATAFDQMMRDAARRYAGATPEQKEAWRKAQAASIRDGWTDEGTRIVSDDPPGTCLPAPPVDSSAAPSTPVDNKISADPVGKEG